MKISVDKNQFLEKLEMANKIIDPKALIENHKYLFIKTVKEKNAVIFRGLNNRTKSSVTAILENVDVEKDFIIGVEGNLLEKIIKKMPNGPVNLVIKDKNNLNVTNDHLSLKMKTIFNESMPDVSIENKLKNSFIINKEDFIKQINKVSFAVSVDESRPILTGVNFCYKGTDLKIAALDGFRLAISKMKMEDIESEEFDLTIPFSFLKDAISILNKTDSDKIKIGFNGNKMVIQAKGLRLKSSLLEGDFVNYEQIIGPSRSANDSVIYDTEMMKNSLDRMSIIAKQDNNALELNINEKKIDLKVSSQNAKSVEKIDLKEETKNNIKIGLNVTYLSDVIKRLDKSTAEMKYSKAVAPIYIGEENLEFLIVPVRLKG